MHNSSNSSSRLFTIFLLTLCDLVFLLGLFALPVIWLLDPFHFKFGPIHFSSHWGFKPVLITLLFLGLRIAIKTRLQRGGGSITGILDRGVIRKLVLSVTMSFLCLYAVEGFLAVIGYKISMAPVVFALSNSKGETEVSEGFYDPELRFRFRKGEKYHGVMINSLGYREREVDAKKKPGTIRIVCMGDSVTAQGEPGYAQLLHNMLNEKPPTTNAWEAFNMAVFGYSSMQGLRVFQLETKFLAPDIVTLYFGWNDHWLEMQTDRNAMAVKVNPYYGRLYNKLKNKRFFMLLSQASNRVKFDVSVRNKPDFRVPPDDYVKVLTEFVKEIRDVGATPIIITAPRREVFPTKDKFPEASANIDYNQVHDQYAELTRQTAKNLGVELLDLNAEFADPACDGYFLKDGIHFNQTGLTVIAQKLDGKIRELYSR